MKGSFEVTVKNRRLQYKFKIYRNITILRGDSATGKTTLIDMIQAYQNGGANSGVQISCGVHCAVLTESNWQLNLSEIHGSIVFIDEGNPFVASKDFADEVRKGDNYFVIATRNPLYNLPYSITEIYGIKNSSGNRYQGTKRLYSSFYPLYADTVTISPQLVIVEDSNSGFEFFQHICEHFSIPCVSARGKTNICSVVESCDAENILIIADGAAFGPEIENLLLLNRIKNLGIFMPESFEWLLLKAKLLEDSAIDRILENPSDSIDSSRYFSWERFFTELLTERSKGTYLEYHKAKLNPSYLQKNELAKVEAILPPLFPTEI